MASVTRIQTTLVGLTAAAMLSLSVAENNIVPSKMYSNPKPIFESKYPWESETKFFNSGYETVLEKYEVIHGFASKILQNSQDVDPSIVEFVSKNFWNLI